MHQTDRWTDARTDRLSELIESPQGCERAYKWRTEVQEIGIICTRIILSILFQILFFLDVTPCRLIDGKAHGVVYGELLNLTVEKT